MSSRSFAVAPAIEDYIASLGDQESPLLSRLREETSATPNPDMQIGVAQGRFLAMLARLIGARAYLEVGVFTGYSSLVLASSLPDNGWVTACDVSEEFTNIARRYWREAGVEHKIDFRLGPALVTLQALLSEGRAATYDMAFIDADKENISAYLEACLELVRHNGLLIVDNTLRMGKVTQDDVDDPDTVAVRKFNQDVMKDTRVEAVLLPLYDGITLVRKK